MFEFCQKMIHSLFDSILLCPRFNSKYYSIKKNPAVSIQKIIQFNSQGIINTGRIGKVPKNCPKSVQNRQKGGFSSKMANIDSKYDSFIHFTEKFNSRDYSVSFFSGIFNSKKYSITFFPENSIQKLIQKFKFGFIQFNKIFIQLENQGIVHH